MVKRKTTFNSILTYFVIVIAFVAIRTISSFGLLSFMGEYGEYVFTIVVQIGLLFCLSIFMFSGLQKQKVKTTFTFYGFKKISWKAVLITIVLGAVVFFLNIFVASFFDIILSLFGYHFHSGEPVSEYPIYMLFVNLIFTAVLPAVCEETAHRGLLLKGQSAYGQKTALIISALLFGLLHMNIEQFFYATIIGLLAGYISIICDSIYPAIIIHFMNNALSVYSGFAAFYKLPFAKILSSINGFLVNNFFLGLLFVLLLVGVLVYILFVLLKMLFRETTGRKLKDLQVELFKEIAKKDYMTNLEQSKAELQGKEDVAPVTVNMEELYVEQNIKMGLMTELDKQLLEDTGKFKPTNVTKAITIACIVLTACITIFTFIWGLL